MFVNNSKHFPSLPQAQSTGTSPISYRPSPNEPITQQNVPESEVQVEQIDQIDFSENFMFGNPLYFIAFLTEAITQTISAKEKNQEIDILQIIQRSAGRRMGLPIDIEQLKSMIR